ncbi:NAD(P)/FAD-dependent oxidoreductase [Massilia sp. CF038]|uniref:flavin-containing monooxygenase n=1 Tax=Massilia sp. CF038 TaxID=1881045 RepID=UPI000923C218|nr:NAD(P)/FAD-dependent oxidoreductase [Massilia sp. CF038]SHG57778.1 Predicted flavoprotein CzcO associated with the cation diffusion facilitator CzcD [Massilia sp. CF038]
MSSGKPQYEVVVVGSGFAGLCTAVKLRAAGIDNFIVLEKDQEAGGTWWANSYPGCAVDVPSHLYSFSFAQNARWTHAFARQGELLAYTRAIVHQFDLQRHLRVATAFEGAAFVEQGGYWDIETSAGPLTAKCIIGATGALNRPAIPDLPGLATFGGKVFHSSRWDHGYDLRGKRVAVVGTGASAIQFVPEIVDQVAQLDLYQRSAPWILPRPDRRIGAREQHLLARLPALHWIYRAMVYLQHEARAPLYVYFPGLFGIAQRLALRHLHCQISDPVLRAKLTPDYTMGCKRVLLMNSYYPALSKVNVELVTDPIARVTAGAIVTASGQERPVDAIIFGTGFNVEHALHTARVRGRGGKVLFQDDLQAYKGCAVAGFPNYFLITGPNTGLGHNSMIYMIESGVRYAVDAVQTIRSRALHSVEVKEEAQRSFNDALQRRMRGTVWSTGCKSWYLDQAGRNYTLWPGFTFTYRRLTRRFDIENYRVNAGA